MYVCMCVCMYRSLSLSLSIPQVNPSDACTWVAQALWVRVQHILQLLNKHHK